jgi:hypothetical protein
MAEHPLWVDESHGHWVEAQALWEEPEMPFVDPFPERWRCAECGAPPPTRGPERGVFCRSCAERRAKVRTRREGADGTN